MQFTPNNKEQEGKIISNKVPKGSNRLKIALRQTAIAIGNLKDTHLADFLKKYSLKKAEQRQSVLLQENWQVLSGT